MCRLISQTLPLVLGVATGVNALGAFLPPLPLQPRTVVLAQGTAQPLGEGALEISADICVDLPDWHRPSSHDQKKQLQAMPQYGPALEDEPLVSALKDWWSHEIFSFTTYGLSARTDPLYLSGLWTAMEATWACYSANQPEALNSGELAEVWLMHHRLVGLQWQNNQYVMTVEPGQAGLQLVQFPRYEREPSLPMALVTPEGEPLPVLSGDW